LIEDIPLTTVTYGYTRVKSEPQNVRDAVDTEASSAQNDDPDGAHPSDSEEVELQLNTFTTQSDPFPTFYAQEMKAEGVLVRLDPEFVLDWLVENNVITDANRPSPDDARMWFVDRIAAPSRYESLVDNQDETHLSTNERQCISRHVYSLINTYAHVFMNTMGSLSGHQRESLVERLMPHTLSFLVYKRPDTDQALGTVLTLFEERFEQFHTQLQEQATCPLIGSAMRTKMEPVSIVSTYQQCRQIIRITTSDGQLSSEARLTRVNLDSTRRNRRMSLSLT